MENFKEKKYTKSESYEPTNQEVSEGWGENLLQLVGFIPVIGEIADIITPNGTMKFEVLEITR